MALPPPAIVSPDGPVHAGPVLLPDPPMVAAERERVEITRLRLRLLGGGWKQDARDRMVEHFGLTGATMVGPVEASANPLKNIARELASLYLSAPTVRHEDREGTADLIAAVERSGLWSQMQRYQAWVIGAREYLMRVDAPEGAGRLLYRPVRPDLVVALSTLDDPGVPYAVHELRPRVTPRGGVEWTWDVLDVGDPERPVYAVRRAGPGGDLGEDISRYALGGQYSGDAYPYRRADGTPILPYVLHHAELLGDRLWDPWEGLEQIEGTLTLAALRAFWAHCVFHASYPIPYGVNVRPAALETVDEDGRAIRHEVVTGPTSWLELEVTEIASGGPPPTVNVGQLSARADPEALLRAIDAYAAQLASDAGVSASDIHKMSGDARSGYAISLTNEGKRAAQRRFAPVFRPVDERMMEISAVLYNRANGTSYPEDGYRVLYAPIPLSPEERRALRDDLDWQLQRGLLSEVDAYMQLHPGISEEMARADLERIRRDRAAVEVQPQGDQAAPPQDPPAAPEAVEPEPQPADAAPVEETDQPEDLGEGLNGAQLREVAVIVERLSYGELELETAAILIELAGVDSAVAQRLARSVKRRERPVEGQPAAAPPPPSDDETPEDA